MSPASVAAAVTSSTNRAERTSSGCGNGVTTSGEQCDDGDLQSGDGCDSNCTPTGCGNGIATAGEGCDDGNPTNTDACLITCALATCGDGFVRSDTAPNACRSNCLDAHCGDDVVDGGEDCDDGNTVGGDACPAACVQPTCGDGVVSDGEQCDDGDASGGDGCGATCLIEAAYGCQGLPSVCRTCASQSGDEDGDGVVDWCDNCPAVANASQANTSETGAGGAADAVGDACDPNPTAGGDSIFYFDGFTSSLATNGWVSSTSLPNVNGGIIEQNSLGDLDLIWRPGASLENVTVDVRGYFGQINQATPPNEMGAIVRGKLLSRVEALVRGGMYEGHHL